MLLDLQKKGLNGIWAKIIKNIFAPAFFENFDYVIGNPPWINWQSLPEEYRNSIKKYWDDYKIFLHKGSWHKFKGYAFSQLHRMSNKEPTGKRLALVEKWGYDIKFAYHVVRLVNEVEQIMVEGDLDITRNREQLKSIRRGEWKAEDIKEWFENKEKALEKVYSESKLQHRPDVEQIQTLLLECLEHHYGSLDKCVVTLDKPTMYLKQIKELIERSGV
jgi:methylase of polypeptide subunit release factors